MVENPAPNQRVSGVGTISGWAFSSTANAHVTVQLNIDGVAQGSIPCCSERPDVAQQFPNTAQAFISGFGLLFNFNRLDEGAHTLAIVAQDSAGSSPQTQEYAITVAKPGGFEFLSTLSLANADDPILTDDKQEIIINKVQATDKTTSATEETNLHLAWQENTQTLGIVQADNVGNPSGGSKDNDGDGYFGSDDCNDKNPDIHPGAREICNDGVDNNCDGLTDSEDPTCNGTANPHPALTVTFENPNAALTAPTVGGIGLISGWTFTQTPNATISNVQVRIDGNSTGDVPCCSERTDVQTAYPDDPQALQSGFGILFNFNRLDSGSHTMTVEVQNSAGQTQTVEHQVNTVKLADSEFLDQFDLSGTTVSLNGETLLLDGVKVRDKATQQTEQLAVSYVWEESCQCFIPQSGCGDGTIESGEECDGVALAGDSCTSLGFTGGTLSCRPRCAADDKNCTLPCLFELTACTGGPLAYVTNVKSNTVSVIDTVTDTVTATIRVGREPRGVAISPDRATAYVTNFQDNTVSVLDTATNTVTATVAVGNGPLGVGFAPNGKKAYVVNGLDNTVSVIDTATHARETDLRVGKEPQAIALTADGQWAYVTNFASNSVTVLDLNAVQPLTTVLVGKGPDGIAISPDGTKVYVVNYNSNTVSVLDRATNKVTDTVQVGLQPTKVTFTADGAKAYVANSIDNTISVIDTEKLTVGNPLTVASAKNVPAHPDSMAVTAGGTRLYVALFGDGFGSELQVVSTVTSGILRSISVGDGPFAIATLPRS